MTEAKKPAVFLDRDGTLMDEDGYQGDPAKVRLLPRAGEAVRLLNEAGYLAIVVTNQSGVGRGMFTEEDVLAVNLRLVQALGEEGGRLDGVYFCPHLPDAGCRCRKPGTLAVERASRDFPVDTASSWMVGDSELDVRLGFEGGLKPVLVQTGKKDKGSVPEGVPWAGDVLDAVRLILDRRA